ncbi:MAG: hypothetical protein PF569_08090 [Candidatus Woesearchaeota archaeon]|jgi:predicted transcriptional regulator of viral defense system|nr:hypothetical protein [Candidatus Woesearchaeota archaeon]
MQYLDIIKELEKKEIFTNKDLEQYFKNPHSIKQFLYELKKKGHIKQIRKGFYTTHDFKDINLRELIKQLYPNCTFIYYSALDIYNKNYFFIFGSYVIATQKQARPLKLDNLEITPIKMDIPCGVTEKEHGENSYKTTDLEMTFIMCIQNIVYSNGLENIHKAFRGGNGLDLDVIIKYLRKINNPKLSARVLFFYKFIGGVVTKNILNEFKLEKTVNFEPGRPNNLLSNELNINYSDRLSEEIE